MGIDENCFWGKTVQFINDLDKDESFRPKDLKKYVYEGKSSSSTVGTYISFLNQTNYIERISKGEYIRVKNIPNTLTTTKIYKYLFDNPLKDRQDKIEQIKKNLNNT